MGDVIRLVVLGGAGVGKSGMFLSFIILHELLTNVIQQQSVFNMLTECLLTR